MEPRAKAWIPLCRCRLREGANIQNGKIEGDKFSFQTVMRTPKGEDKLN